MLIDLYNKANPPTLVYISTSHNYNTFSNPKKSKFRTEGKPPMLLRKGIKRVYHISVLHIQEHQNKVYTMKNLYNALILTAYNTRSTHNS